MANNKQQKNNFDLNCFTNDMKTFLQQELRSELAKHSHNLASTSLHAATPCAPSFLPAFSATRSLVSPTVNDGGSGYGASQEVVGTGVPPVAAVPQASLVRDSSSLSRGSHTDSLSHNTKTDLG